LGEYLEVGHKGLYLLDFEIIIIITVIIIIIFYQDLSLVSAVLASSK